MLLLLGSIHYSVDPGNRVYTDFFRVLAQPFGVRTTPQQPMFAVVSHKRTRRAYLIRYRNSWWSDFLRDLRMGKSP